MQSRLTRIKNFLWSLAIVVCLLVLISGILFTIFRKYSGVDSSFNINLGESGGRDKGEGETDILVAGDGENLKLLKEGKDAGQEYIDSLVFLCDSTLIGLRDYQLLKGTQVWGTGSGSYPVNSLVNGLIKYPNDGQEIPAQSCAMLSKPDILVVAVGTDGINEVTEDSFKDAYRALITGIQDASPKTKIICCALTSISPNYNGSVPLTATLLGDGCDWIMDVCEETGVYYANIREPLCDRSGMLMTEYAAANGKSVNSTGLKLILEYLQTHPLK